MHPEPMPVPPWLPSASTALVEEGLGTPSLTVLGVTIARRLHRGKQALPQAAGSLRAVRTTRGAGTPPASPLAPSAVAASVLGSLCQMVNDTQLFTRTRQSSRQEQSVLCR